MRRWVSRWWRRVWRPGCGSGGRGRTLLGGEDRFSGLNIDLTQNDHLALTVGGYAAETYIVAQYRPCIDKNIFGYNGSCERDTIENLYVGIGTREEKVASAAAGSGRLHLKGGTRSAGLINLEHNRLIEANTAVVHVDLGVDHVDVAVNVNLYRIVCVTGDRHDAVGQHEIACYVVCRLLRAGTGRSKLEMRSFLYVDIPVSPGLQVSGCTRGRARGVNRCVQ